MQEDAEKAPRWAGWVLALGTTLACLLILELGLRAYLGWVAGERQVAKYAREWDIPPSLRMFRPHPYLIYVLNEAYRSRDGLNRHNSLGYRGEDFTREKPEGVYRIACLGGSTTYSTGVRDYRDSFPDQLQRVLRERHGAGNVHVVNAGVPGYNSWESLINLQFRVLDLSPDLIVVYHGTNDVHARLVPPERYVRDNEGHRKPWDPDPYAWWERSVLLRYLGVRLGVGAENRVGYRTERLYGDAVDPDAALAANPPVYFAENLRDMIVLSRSHGAEIMLSTWAHRPGMEDDYASFPHYQRGFRENNETVLQVGEEEGVPVYDFDAEMPRDAGLWSDGRHLTATGTRKKADLFAAFIAERFLKPSSGPGTPAGPG